MTKHFVVCLTGAIAALIVGSIHMALGIEYGLTLILFYMTGSKLTRVGSKAKAALEEKHEEGGYRTATQAHPFPAFSLCCPLISLSIVRRELRAFPCHLALVLSRARTYSPWRC